MSAAALVSMFLVGLLGSTHCLGMCGGIVTALSVRLPGERPRRLLQIAYHAGRIATYITAGALAAGLGSAALLLDGVLPMQIVLYVIAQLMLVALGLYLLGVPRYLDVFERAGRALWRRVQPASVRLLPVRTLHRALAYGMVWGLLPCGLVYSVLAIALVSGDAASGALVMLAFGLGTLPALLAAGALLPELQQRLRAPLARRAAGGIIVAFGLIGLAYAGEIETIAGNSIFCRTLPR
jgi:sulfite exporter TauE/SafE